jgi:type I restriction enzyme S subunit
MKLPVENYEFPRDWKVSPVSDVADFFRGVSWGKAEEAPEGKGLLVISIPNIKDGWIDYDSKFNHYLSTEVAASKRLNVGDIVFVGSSGSIHNVGRNARVTSLPNGSVAFASFTFKAAPKPTAIDGEFFYYLVNSDLVPFPLFCKRAADGKFNFQLRDFANRLAIPIPPLPEQKKISHILSTVQRAIEAQERIIKTTTELKKALMHKLFTEGLRGEPQKQTEIGLVPESWEVHTLGDLFETQLGKMLSQKAKVGDSPKVYLRNKNVQWGRIDTADLLRMDFSDREAEKFQLRRGDLLVCEGGEVGRAALWDGRFEDCYYQKALHRLRPKTDQISNEFMVHWLMFAFRLTNTYRVTGTRTTIAHLPEIKLKQLLVPVPSAAEQADIVAALVCVDQKISGYQAKLGTLKDLFRTLLHELMTGKVRVNHVMIRPHDA